jgi:hypothetical protein
MENEKRAQELAKKSIVEQTPKKIIKKISLQIKEKAELTVNFFILWTAVSLYYFFSGLSLVIHGKLPKGWRHFDKKQLNDVITNVGEFTQERKDEVKYGKVVDLDYTPPEVDLAKE